MDSTLDPAADRDTLLLKIGIMYRRCVKSVEGSRVRIARSGQLMAESNTRTSAKVVRAPIHPAKMDRQLIPDWIKHPESLLERVRQTRERSELLLRQTREIITRSRAMMIEPL